MRLDKDFKKEVNTEISKGSYIARKIIFKIVIVIVILSILSLGGWFVNRMFTTNAERVIFKQSLTYNEGVLDDLAKYKLEMIQSEDEVEKKAIANLVVDRFANYDESKIESQDLRNFLMDCRNLDVEDY